MDDIIYQHTSNYVFSLNYFDRVGMQLVEAWITRGRDEVTRLPCVIFNERE